MPKGSIEFQEAAAADYDVAFDWYLERSPDAASEFADEVERAPGSDPTRSRTLGNRTIQNAQILAEKISISSYLPRVLS